MSELTPGEAQVLFDALDALKTDNQLVALRAHSVCALLAPAELAKVATALTPRARSIDSRDATSGMRGGPPIQAGTAPVALAGRPGCERKRFRYRAYPASSTC
jgi:hypothetical protein